MHLFRKGKVVMVLMYQNNDDDDNRNNKNIKKGYFLVGISSITTLDVYAKQRNRKGESGQQVFTLNTNTVEK